MNMYTQKNASCILTLPDSLCSSYRELLTFLTESTKGCANNLFPSSSLFSFFFLLLMAPGGFQLHLDF